MQILSRSTTAAVAALAIVAVAGLTLTPAEAQRRRGGDDGAGVAAGVLGGLAAGALVGGALSGPLVADPGVEPFDGPYGDDVCPLVRQPVYDGAGRFAGYRTIPAC